ncbi:MAG: 2-hydroxyacid dehydrogenase [Synergistota bacterium]|nr:2-hydroxyacid dehydrogenase [Synergistota bacterium]
MKIALLESLGISENSLERLAASLTKDGHDFSSFPRSDDRDENISRLSGVDVAIIANMPLSGEVIAGADSLKMISVAFTGYDHVDMKVCMERGIAVSNCAGYSTDSVAELALGLSIAVCRNILPCDRAVRDGATKVGLLGNEIAGKTVGIVGTGAIGCKVAKIFRVLGCSVLAYSRTERDELKELGVSYVTLEELMVSSDIVSVHVPCNDETVGLIGEEKLAMMKPSAILINTARGPIVDNDRLAEALTSGGLSGAGIDVFDMESPIPKNYPLLKAPNCVLTPHVAFATPEALEKRAVMAFDNICAWISGSPRNLVF